MQEASSSTQVSSEEDSSGLFQNSPSTNQLDHQQVIVAAQPVPQIPPVQPNQPNAPMAWRPADASPMTFPVYHDLPKNPEHFCSKFHSGDLNHTADEHVKLFEDLLQNRDIQEEDVACRLFPYTFDEEASYWYIHLPANSIRTWQQMKTAFLEKFRPPIAPSDLYRQFVEIKRQEHEPISTFNNRFHKAYTRLRDPYLLDNAAALPIYYEALDRLTAMFVKSTNPLPADLKGAYVVAITASTGLGIGLAPGPLHYLGNAASQNQIQDINRALAHQTPMMNPIPSNQMVLHPGMPVSQVPPTQPIYLQNVTTPARTQEEKDEMRELIEQVKRLSTEVTYLKGQTNQMQNFQKNYQPPQGNYQGQGHSGYHRDTQNYQRDNQNSQGFRNNNPGFQRKT